MIFPSPPSYRADASQRLASVIALVVSVGVIIAVFIVEVRYGKRWNHATLPENPAGEYGEPNRRRGHPMRSPVLVCRDGMGQAVETRRLPSTMRNQLPTTTSGG